MDLTAAQDLLDWKRRVFDLYRAIREHDEPKSAWALWRKERDALFAEHPQSPLTPRARSTFRGLELFDYDERFRFLAELEEAESRDYDIPTSGEETMRLTRLGVARFEVEGAEARLEVYWLTGYGGGVFLPFRDLTSGRETYGAGRYVLDTVKGADLGTKEDRLVVDFNFAYNPSCAYDPRWVCPLAPTPNRLEVAITAGEKTPGPDIAPG